MLLYLIESGVWLLLGADRLAFLVAPFNANLRGDPGGGRLYVCPPPCHAHIEHSASHKHVPIAARRKAAGCNRLEVRRVVCCGHDLGMARVRDAYHAHRPGAPRLRPRPLNQLGSVHTLDRIPESESSLRTPRSADV